MGAYDLTLGVLQIGMYVNTFLFGLVTYQFAAYYHRKFNDRAVVKFMVLFLFIIDTFQSVAIIYMAWYYTVANFNNPAALEVGVWPFQLSAITDAITAFVTQLYLGSRIWHLTGSKILYTVAIVLAIPPFVLGMIGGIWTFIIRYPSKLVHIAPLLVVWWSLLVVEDIYITVTLVTIFISSRTGFRKMDTVLSRLTRGAIQTGLFASIFTMGVLLTFILLPTTDVFGMFALPLGRIYTNTLMDTLLTREFLSRQLNTTNAEDTTGEVVWASIGLAGSQVTTTGQTSVPIKNTEVRSEEA